MKPNKQIVLVPRWVHDTISRNKLSQADLLDYDKIQNVLSKRDLAAMLAVQNLAHVVVGGKPLQATGSFVLFNAWVHSAQKYRDNNIVHVVRPGEPEHVASMDRYGDVISPDIMALSNDPSFVQELQERLFHEDSRDSNVSEPFITYDITPEYGLLVINPGFYNPTMTHKDGNELYLSTVKAVLALLYVYKAREPHEVARALWFTRYLELLSELRLAV